MQSLRPSSGQQKPRTSWQRLKGAASDWRKYRQGAQNRKDGERKRMTLVYSYLRDNTLGEWMQRIGQPGLIGQLLAGIILPTGDLSAQFVRPANAQKAGHRFVD